MDVPKGYVIALLWRPPPKESLPWELSTYQNIEEPILKCMHGSYDRSMCSWLAACEKNTFEPLGITNEREDR